MRYAGTSRRPPCPVCNGSGVDTLLQEHRAITRPCIACNGTRVRPLSSPVAAQRRSDRIKGIRRAQETR